MIKQSFIDTFRELYPNKREFLWSNRKNSTRIDLIWISDSLIFSLKDVLIKEIILETDSDYELVVAELLLDHLDFRNSLA